MFEIPSYCPNSSGFTRKVVKDIYYYILKEIKSFWFGSCFMFGNRNYLILFNKKINCNSVSVGKRPAVPSLIENTSYFECSFNQYI